MNEKKSDIITNIVDANILIVDDQELNIKLIDRILSMKGYSNIYSTQDPTEVLTLYKEHNFDLILLDLEMPKLDGFAVMEQLNFVAEITLPPILILTAQDLQSFRQRALDNGARDYVTKPFNANELLSRVRNLLEVQMAHKYMRHQNEILEQKVRERTKEINETRLQIIRHLGRAAEFRDNETGYHIIRMSKIAVVLAKAIGMNEEQCELLLNAAPMHDIGKIGIADKILLKPGKFDSDEWSVMQTHAEIGAEILSEDNSDLMNMARDIAISHHEKWNGNGYPNKLKAEEIPLVGRITAIADVFDALTSKRPYKNAWSKDQALSYIKSESGQHFDPALVNIFFEKYSEIERINEQYTEPMSA